MALRRMTTRMWGPAAACALRRQPAGPVVPRPPPPLSRFLGTTFSQAKPQSNIKGIQHEGVLSMFEKGYLLAELENIVKVAKQRMVELEEVRRQQKKARTIYGFTLAALFCMTVYAANMSTPTPMVEQGNTSP